MADTKILELLGSDSKGVPYYLHPLNLVWSDSGADHDLILYRKVADKLTLDKGYWAEVIRSPSWRESLAGCTCLLASSRHEFFEDLCLRFKGGSFITPQIAVTLGLLHGPAARTFLESFLDDADLRSRSKEAISAHRVLLHLGAKPKHDINFEKMSVLDQDNSMVAEQVVAKHWEFWSKRVAS